MLKDKYEDDILHTNSLFILGYNILPDISHFRKNYPGKKIIIYQLEQLHPHSMWVNEKNKEILAAADEVWDYDESNIVFMLENYQVNAKFHPILYSKTLETIKTVENPDIDILFYGYMFPRRAKIVHALQMKLGTYRIFDLFGVWGEELDTYISRSKIILNIHTDEPNIAVQEQVRMFYAVENHKCVVSEFTRKNYMGKSIVQATAEHIPGTCEHLLKTEKWKEVAASAKDEFIKSNVANMEHARNIESALERIKNGKK
jgi:hypothetical protein